MGPHSLECDADGNIWITCAIGGKMAKFDVKTEKWLVVSSAPDPARRGVYPHTLRVDKKGVVWYTDAGRGVYSLDPNNDNVRKFYKLPDEDQAVGQGIGESRGRTPYGIDVAPNGHIWYTKLNGNRVGRIKPEVPDGDIKEWNPPFRGPRRLQVDCRRHGVGTGLRLGRVCQVQSRDRRSGRSTICRTRKTSSPTP